MLYINFGPKLGHFRQRKIFVFGGYLGMEAEKAGDKWLLFVLMGFQLLPKTEPSHGLKWWCVVLLLHRLQLQHPLQIYQYILLAFGLETRHNYQIISFLLYCTMTLIFVMSWSHHPISCSRVTCKNVSFFSERFREIRHMFHFKKNSVPG